MMRSIRSFLVEVLLRITKKKLDVNEFMDKRSQINSESYQVPAKLKQKYNITKDGNLPLDTYVLKSNSRSDERIVLYLPGGGYVEQPLNLALAFLTQLNGAIELHGFCANLPESSRQSIYGCNRKCP